MPSSSISSRARHSWKLSVGSRLPPGNSHRPPRWASGNRLVIRRLPSRNTRPAATSMIAPDFDWDRGFDKGLERLSPDAFINEAEALHFGGIKQIAPVKENRVAEGFANTLEVEFFEVIPCGGD